MKTQSIVTAAVIAAALMIAPFATEIARSDTTPDFSGTWRLDRTRSDSMPGHGEGGGGRHWGGLKAPQGGGHWGEGHGGGGGAGFGGKGGMHRIPQLFTLTMSGNTIEMRDSTNAVVERLFVGETGSLPAMGSDNVPQFRAGWQGQALQIDLVGPNGGTATQTVELADGGQTLRVITQRTAQNGEKNPPPAFTRVYTKVSGS
jgi:hypothetical protein